MKYNNDVMEKEVIDDILTYAMSAGIAISLTVIVALFETGAATMATITLTTLIGFVTVFGLIPYVIAGWTDSTIKTLFQPRQKRPKNPVKH